MTVADQPEAIDRGDAPRLRWARVFAATGLLGAVFFVYEHAPASYAGGARAGVNESRLRDKVMDDVEEGNAPRRIALVGFGLFGLLGAAVGRDQNWNPRWLGVAAVLALVLWAAASTGWAEDRGLSVRRLLAALLAALGALGVARLLRPREVIAAALVSLSALVMLSLAIDIAAGARPWLPGERFAGTLHANTQATYCGALCLAAQRQSAPFGWRWAPRLLLLAGLLAIGLTKSRTGALAVLVGMFASTAARLHAGVRIAFLAFAFSVSAAAVILVASVGDGVKAQIRETALLGRTQQSKSLTGRLPLWEELLTYAHDRPLQGYGYSCFWTPDRIDAIMQSEGWTIMSSHNAYLELLLQIGVIGLGLTLIVTLLGWQSLQSGFDRSHDVGYAFGIGLLGFALTDSLLQTHFVAVSYPTTLLMIVIFNAFLFHPSSTEPAPTPAAGPLDRPIPA